MAGCATTQKRVCDGQLCMQHNVGLCRMDGCRGGAGVEFSKGYGAPGGRAWGTEQSYKKGEKALRYWCRFGELIKP